MKLTQLSRRAGVAALVVIGFVGAGLGSASAGSQRAVVSTAPLDFTEAQGDIEDCVGETLTVTAGEYRIVLANNVFHANAVSGAAVGDESGAIYRITGHQQDLALGGPTSAGVYTTVVTLNAIGQGGAGKFSAHFLFRMTFTPAGVPTADITKIDVRCV